jgi:hypothetical protein
MAQIVKKRAKSISYTSISIGDKGIGGLNKEFPIRSETDKMLLLDVPEESRLVLVSRLLRDQVNKVRVKDMATSLLFEVYSDMCMKDAQSLLASAAMQHVDMRESFYRGAKTNLKLLVSPRAKRKNS